MKRLILIITLFITFMNGFTQTPKKKELVELNGTNIYYEVYGSGEPLILLHAFTATSKSWHPYIESYANQFEVYLVDLKGHGKSSPFSEKLSIKDAAIELDALIKYLQLDSIKAIGYSYGGDILFQLALHRPALIKSMVCIGATGTWNINDVPAWLDYLSYKNIDHLPWMREQQENEDRIKSILEQVPNYHVKVSDDELKTIQVKTLLVFGDNDDSISLEEIARAKMFLPTSYLWIVPNTGHGAHKDNNKAEFVRVTKEFLTDRWTK